MTRLSVTEMLAARVLSCVCCCLMVTITAGRQVRSHQLIPSQSRNRTLGSDLYPSPPKGPGCPVGLLLGTKKLAEGSRVALTLAQHPTHPWAMNSEVVAAGRVSAMVSAGNSCQPPSVDPTV